MKIASHGDMSDSLSSLSDLSRRPVDFFVHELEIILMPSVIGTSQNCGNFPEMLIIMEIPEKNCQI